MNLPEEHAELLDLIDAAYHGVIEPAQVARLEAILKGNPEAQWFYLRQIDLHGSIAWTCSANAEHDVLCNLRERIAPCANTDVPSPDSTESLLMEAIEIDARARARRQAERELDEAARQRDAAERLDAQRFMFDPAAQSVPVRHIVIPRWLAYGAVAAIVALTAMLVWPMFQRTPIEPVSDPAPPTIAFTLSGEVDAVWAADGEPRGIIEGNVQHLTASRLQLESGWVELVSRRGARIIVQGPAVFEPSSEEELKLHAGQLMAYCPPGAEGLTVLTPRGTVVDLGTRFGVTVEPQRDVEVYVFEGAVDAVSLAGDKVRLHSGDFALVERERVVPQRNVVGVSAWRFVSDLAEARRRRVLEVPFSDAVRYIYRDSYLSPTGSSGTYRVRGDALHIEPGPGNTATVFLPMRQQLLAVGDIWAVDVELDYDERDSLGAYVTVSADFVQPGRASENFNRRNVPGLLVRRTTLDQGVVRLHSVYQRSAPINDLSAPSDSGGEGLSDPGGPLTIVVHRVAANRFAFHVGVAATGELIKLGERTHDELATYRDLCLGFECYSMRGTSTAMFSRLRKLEQVDLWRDGGT